MGSRQDPEDPLQSSYNKSTSPGSVGASSAFQHGNEMTLGFLRLHIARSAADEDHHRAVTAAIRKPPSDRKRPPGRPNHTWLRAIEPDLRPLIIGPSYAWKKAASRDHWRSIVDTATLKKSMPRRALFSGRVLLISMVLKKCNEVQYPTYRISQLASV